MNCVIGDRTRIPLIDRQFSDLTDGLSSHIGRSRRIPVTNLARR
ncbi:hypothetical protein PACID_19120 [Acidipropionibacterium acidipropionici ATCC 4875]|uniref:Uncharacterized protein n=1 Tax=Acidipropionibacterium acidipropionici (strain ATCC 4875 / DSM 20272 / JCM 6432 / NBRC 12425 / NCIMB 8070 / 4) TaxID=1171373 RepID=K7RTI6_ACIA4|nr:hypothetical protein PACID_19120 [Acidipropionibacterium acidipropionici ATCC 4875]